MYCEGKLLIGCKKGYKKPQKGSDSRLITKHDMQFRYLFQFKLWLTFENHIVFTTLKHLYYYKILTHKIHMSTKSKLYGVNTLQFATPIWWVTKACWLVGTYCLVGEGNTWGSKAHNGEMEIKGDGTSTLCAWPFTNQLGSTIIHKISTLDLARVSLHIDKMNNSFF